MASNQPDNNCCNCNDRHEKSTFKACVDCIKKATRENPFPEWSPIQEAKP